MDQKTGLGIMIFQLQVACEFLSRKQYVKPPEAKKFVNLLYADALRYGSILERDALIKRYRVRENDEGLETFGFFDDLIDYITGGHSAVKGIGSGLKTQLPT